MKKKKQKVIDADYTVLDGPAKNDPEDDEEDSSSDGGCCGCIFLIVLCAFCMKGFVWLFRWVFA